MLFIFTRLKDVKNEYEHKVGVRLLEISEPSFVGNFIIRRPFEFCEYFKQTVLKVGSGIFADYINAERALNTNNYNGRFYKAKLKQVKQ